MNPAALKVGLGILERLIRPLMLAFGLWKVKKAGRVEAEKEQLEDELEAIDDARAARTTLADDRVRSELEDWRRSRG